jgi:hypothetical protein
MLMAVCAEWVGCAYRYNRKKTTAANTCRKRISLSQHNLFLPLIAILKGEDMIIEIANDAIIKTWE